MTYIEWGKRHATMFGVNDPAGIAMILSWEPLFTKMGYTPDDLSDVTDWLGMHAPPSDRWHHLEAILSAMRQARAVAYRQEEAEHREDRGTCTLCGGAGRVIVPHRQGIVSGQWVPIQVARGGPSYYTMAVLCSCPLGRWVEQRLLKASERMRRLEDYEAENPRWREQLRQRHEEQLERAKLGVPPSPEFAAVVERLRQQYGLTEEKAS